MLRTRGRVTNKAGGSVFPGRTGGAKPEAGGASPLAHRRLRLALLAAALVGLAFCSRFNIFGAVDNAFYGLRCAILEQDASGDLAVVEIDPKSLHAAGEWPWPRERFARAVMNLRAAGATLIGFDVDFSARSSTEQDGALRDAIDANADMIVLPTFVQRDGQYENAPLLSIAENARIAGVNVPIDSDGAVRRYKRGFSGHDGYRASMGSVLAGPVPGRTDTFLIDYGIRAGMIDRISFEDVLENRFDASRVAGKRILIGATALEFGDFFATPIGPATPGVMVHALAFESLRQDRALTRSSPLLTFLCGAIALIALWPKGRTLRLRRFLVVSALVLCAALSVPLAVQAFFPVSLDASSVLLAQALSLWVTVQCELDRRARDVVIQREEVLRRTARLDPETELPNRRAMLEDLRSQIALHRAGASNAIVVLAIGIDRFTTLRGAIGYTSANKLIRALAEQIGACAAGADAYHLSTSIIATWIVMDVSDNADERGADFLKSIDTSLLIEDQAVHVELHAGAAFSDDDADCAERLLENATMALDQARKINKRYVAYATDQVDDPKRRLAILSGARRGLRNNEFSLVYQPKYSTRSGDFDSAEALVRWRHPQFGNIPPGEFIPLFEETSAIEELTLWIVQRVLEDQGALQGQGIAMTISINVSARSLSNIDFRNRMMTYAGGRSRELCLEVTETAIMDDPSVAIESIDIFRVAGFKISIDDYGSGLSSLSYLKQIAADELKIDRSLIVDLAASERDRLMMRSTVDLAHALGMTVTAEGIEDEITHTLLATMGCDSIQGYFICRPLPFADFVSFVKAHERAARSGSGTPDNARSDAPSNIARGLVRNG